LGNPSEETIDEALRRYRERFEAKGMYENRVYPGIVEMLKQIVAIGVPYGYGSRQELENAGATWICDSPASVLEVLRTRFGNSCGIR